MRQHEAVIQTIESLGGIATLGQINQTIFKIKECDWKTKTPFASIRRIVQLHKSIYKIKPGLYALKKYKDRFSQQHIVTDNPNDLKKSEEFSHSYYQGLILEIGHMKGFETYVPAQDKNKLFLNKPLKEVSSMNKIYDFTYQSLVNRAKTIDVIWFNEKKLPSSVFEVEHSTNMQNALLKFNELRDFYAKFYIVSPCARKVEFYERLNYSAFNEIKNRVIFRDYEYISSFHTKISELYALEQL